MMGLSGYMTANDHLKTGDEEVTGQEVNDLLTAGPFPIASWTKVISNSKESVKAEGYSARTKVLFEEHQKRFITTKQRNRKRIRLVVRQHENRRQNYRFFN